MKDNILERYDINENNDLLIKIYTKNIEDLYEDYDKKSSFIKKDLNHKLEEYLFESVKEIGNQNFEIQFIFENKIEKESELRLKNSIRDYFLYLRFLEKKNLRENLKNSSLFIVIGFILISLSFKLSDHSGFLYKLFSEGTMVAGWVALWEALAILLVNWLPLYKKLRILKRIAFAKISCFKS